MADEADTYLWDVQGWYGGDRDRWWVKSEGEGESGDSGSSSMAARPTWLARKANRHR